MDEYDAIELFHRMTAAWTSDDPEIRDPMADDVVQNNHPKFATLLHESTFPPSQKLYHEIEALTLDFEPWSRREAAWERDKDDWWKLKGVDHQPAGSEDSKNNGSASPERRIADPAV
jgi:hypothetical protein